MGIFGDYCAGKNSFAEFLRDIASEWHTVSIHRLLDPIIEAADAVGIKKTDANLQDLVAVLEQRYGKWILGEEIWRRAIKDVAELIILDGLRQAEDFVMFCRFPKNIAAHITAPPKVRHQRRPKKAVTEERDVMSCELFFPKESFRPTISEVNWEYENVGSLADLKRDAEHFYLQKVYPLLTPYRNAGK